NAPGNIKAENNFWGSYIPDTVEAGIFHQPDDGTLGLVDYLPISPLTTGLEEVRKGSGEGLIQACYPNPAPGELTLRLDGLCPGGKQVAHAMVFGLDGRLMHSESLVMNQEELMLDLKRLPEGMYHLVVEACGRRESRLISLLR
ncbi:MAG TPA: hypothetical protein P5248_11825, partial [Bacteroidales bacterium]|nr:hypothetical protein [Bacteroidales bacterium]